jgi:LemA protein
MEIVLLILLAVIVIWFIMGYNKFIRLIEAVKNSQKEIGVQLDRRGKVFDSLISAVKQYMSHESNVLTKLTELRQKTASPTVSAEEKTAAENELSKLVSSGSLQSGITMTMEAYPDLKASNNMLQLQEEIVSTENKLNFAKKGYNNNVETYYVAKKSFPNLFLPKMFSGLNQEFEYWSLTEEQVKVEEARRVDFNN